MTLHPIVEVYLLTAVEDEENLFSSKFSSGIGAKDLKM